MLGTARRFGRNAVKLQNVPNDNIQLIPHTTKKNINLINYNLPIICSDLMNLDWIASFLNDLRLSKIKINFRLSDRNCSIENKKFTDDVLALKDFLDTVANDLTIALGLSYANF